MLNTIDEACDFIDEWFGENGDRGGEPIAGSIPIPNCVLRLNARVGALWCNVKHSRGLVLEYEAPSFGLFDGQDRIFCPNDYVVDPDGVVSFVHENQGVWRYGYHRDEVDQLLVSGDWCDGLSGAFESQWRSVPATTQDALICALLINLCMQSDADWDDNVSKPISASLQLWNHPAWSDFDGFWTNEDRTLIYFSGWQVRRP